MKKIVCCILFLLTSTSHAAISLSQTRVIYNGADNAAAVEVKNNVEAPYMVQTWLDMGNETVVPKNLPMLVTPPILKLDGNKSAILRIIYQGSGLPENVETVYWINVQEIPTANGENNTLQLAQRIRIKLFYRPKNLNISLQEAAEKLHWQCQGNKLTVTNNSPLHVSLNAIETASHTVDADMVNPHSSETFTLPLNSTPQHIRYNWINDYGGTSAKESVPVSCH